MKGDYGLFQLFDDNRNHPDIDRIPKCWEELLPFADQCRENGLDSLADYLEYWHWQLQFHREREWDAQPYVIR